VTHLVRNAYGKSRVRLTRVTRHPDRHDLKEVTIDVELEGDFEATYTEGDNRSVIATDTMKNTVYALARNHPLDHIEGFGVHLAKHFADGYEQVSSATIRLAEDAWTRISVDGNAHPTAFVGGSAEKRTCTVRRSGGATSVRSGLRDLLVLKTTDSGFSGFARDQYTTLKEADDRILATVVTAEWVYEEGDHDWNACFEAARLSMLERFATHHSLSVQQTLMDMGNAALEACPAISEISLQLPNSHRIPIDLSPFGMDNPNAVFVPTDEPFGMISGTLRRNRDGR
jgi:urate oxidase